MKIMKFYIHYMQIFNSFLKFIKARFTSFISNLFFFFLMTRWGKLWDDSWHDSKSSFFRKDS